MSDALATPNPGPQQGDPDQKQYFAYSLTGDYPSTYNVRATDDIGETPSPFRMRRCEREAIGDFRLNVQRFIEDSGVLQFPTTARVHAIAAESGGTIRALKNLRGLTNAEISEVMGEDFSIEDAEELPERTWEKKYFDGKVRSVPARMKVGEDEYRDGTFGEVDPGEYTFPAGGETGEEIIVMSGDMKVETVSGEPLERRDDGNSEIFFVPKGVELKLTATTTSTYQCTYV